MEDDQFINQIAPDVLHALEGKQFFEALDDRMSPEDPERLPVLCSGTYSISTAILTNCGFVPSDIADILEVLASRGGCCDCEVLFNVAEESRLRSEYWKARATGKRPPSSHPPHVDS